MAQKTSHQRPRRPTKDLDSSQLSTRFPPVAPNIYTSNKLHHMKMCFNHKHVTHTHKDQFLILRPRFHQTHACMFLQDNGSQSS
uniref:Uncharacterized protein n=1 Tax=Arion vulgaris TaxID=1028688 RepID=A0A0B7B5D6_9EUPU